MTRTNSRKSENIKKGETVFPVFSISGSDRKVEQRKLDAIKGKQ